MDQHKNDCYSFIFFLIKKVLIIFYSDPNVPTRSNSLPEVIHKIKNQSILVGLKGEKQKKHITFKINTFIALIRI